MLSRRRSHVRLCRTSERDVGAPLISLNALTERRSVTLKVASVISSNRRRAGTGVTRVPADGTLHPLEIGIQAIQLSPYHAGPSTPRSYAWTRALISWHALVPSAFRHRVSHRTQEPPFSPSQLRWGYNRAPHGALKPVATLEIPRSVLLVAVRLDQRGVNADHHHRTQVPITGPQRRDRATASLDQLPHPLPDPVAHQRDPGHARGRSRSATATSSGPTPPARTVVADPAAPRYRPGSARRPRSTPPRPATPRPGRGVTSGRDNAADKPLVRPRLSASMRGITLPACPTTSSPRTSTRTPFDQSVVTCI